MIVNRVRRKKVRATFFLFFFYALFVTLRLQLGCNSECGAYPRPLPKGKGVRALGIVQTSLTLLSPCTSLALVKQTKREKDRSSDSKVTKTDK